MTDTLDQLKAIVMADDELTPESKTAFCDFLAAVYENLLKDEHPELFYMMDEDEGSVADSHGPEVGGG